MHPVIALESHQENLAVLVSKALKYLPNAESKSSSSREPLLISNGNNPIRKLRPDFISVTRGPGMRSNLAVGLDTAKGLALGMQIPLVGVHHMQAHALTPRLVSAMQPTSISSTPDPEFPFLTLLISGGHTLLLESTGLTEHKMLAETSDVAIGDAIDKIARFIIPPEVLESSTSVMYGPLIESFAFPDVNEHGLNDLYAYEPPATRGEEMERKPTSYGWQFSPPLSATGGGKKSRNMEFSFTGLVSAVERCMTYEWDRKEGKVTKNPRKEDVSVEERRDMAKEAMRVAFEHLAGRIVMALKSNPSDARVSPGKINSLVVSGGVAANKYLRHILRSFLDARGFEHVRLLFPPLGLCTDNAAMIGWTGIEMYKAGYTSNLYIRPIKKWSLDSFAGGGGILGVTGWEK